MPIEAPEKPILKDVSRIFVGVDLRSDVTSIPAGGLAKGINVDLYEKRGSILARRGIETVLTGFDSAVRKIIRALDSIFVATLSNLYRDGSLANSGMDFNREEVLSMVAIRSNRSSQEEIFIANGQNHMMRYTENGGIGTWGIEPPPLPPDNLTENGASGSLGAGEYKFKYTYLRKLNTVVLQESNPSPESAGLTISASSSIDVNVYAPYNQPDVTHIRLYRTAVGGSTFLVDQDSAVGDVTLESTIADAALGGAVEENNNPPEPATLAHVLRERVFINDVNNGGRIHYSKRFEPESFPAANFLDLGSQTDRITSITSINGVLIVFTESTKYRVIEQIADIDAVGGSDIPFIGAATAGFQAIEIPSSRGTLAPRGPLSTGKGIFYPTKEGVFVSDGASSNETLLSGDIQTIFIGTNANDIPPIDWSRESRMTSAYHRGRYYLSYPSVHSSDGQNDYTAIFDAETQKWWFWNVGFSAFLFDDKTNRFYAGSPEGRLEEIEKAGITWDPSSADITVSATTPSRDAGDLYALKVFYYLRIDAEVNDNDTLTVGFYADETLAQSYTITGSRTRALLRLPPNTRGYVWKVSFSGTASNRMVIHGAETQYKPLHFS